jgi:glycosyltransferase involved in cell wall biosynthesis
LEKKFFAGKNILIISPESWEHLFVSKHHYAIALSKLNKVYFLNPAEKKYSSKKTKYENLWEVDYPAFIPGLRYFPSFIQLLIFKKKYKAIETLVNTKFDCIWSFDNSIFFDFSFLPSSVFTISHIVDYAQNFQLKKAARTARLCMGVSQNIVDLLNLYNPNTFLMPHGIALNSSQSDSVILPGASKVKAIFAGNLDRKHFDREILFRLANEHPEVDFIFYGSGGKDWQRLKNTFYPGVVESEHLLHYLKKADILLLPYKFDEFPKELTNSHKVLDYLQSGNVVVSSYLEDYSDKQHLLKMAHNPNEFSQAFSEVIADLAKYNSDANKKIRIKHVWQNSYSKRMEEIEELISKVRSS